MLLRVAPKSILVTHDMSPPGPHRRVRTLDHSQWLVGNNLCSSRLPLQFVYSNRSDPQDMPRSPAGSPIETSPGEIPPVASAPLSPRQRSPSQLHFAEPRYPANLVHNSWPTKDGHLRPESAQHQFLPCLPNAELNLRPQHQLPAPWQSRVEVS